MAVFEFYRRPVAGLHTKDAVLTALSSALSEVSSAIQEGAVTSADLAEALTFLKRYYERLERLILSEGVVDYRRLIALQQADPVLAEAKRRFERQQAKLKSRSHLTKGRP